MQGGDLEGRPPLFFSCLFVCSFLCIRARPAGAKTAPLLVMGRLELLVVLVLLPGICADGPVVLTPLGPVKGVDYGSFVAFKGVRIRLPSAAFFLPSSCWASSCRVAPRCACRYCRRPIRRAPCAIRGARAKAPMGPKHTRRHPLRRRLHGTNGCSYGLRSA